MTYHHIGVEPLSGALGAEIQGVNLSLGLSDEMFAEIHRAFLEQYAVPREVASQDERP